MSEANWYVVHTYSGYENKVKTNIEQTIENRKLQDQILEVSVPIQEAVEIKNGVKKVTQKKMFPGYVLINMVMNDDTWYVVRNTRGVTGFVGPGSKPVPLTDAEMLSLGINKGPVTLEFSEGDTVAVIKGVWEGRVTAGGFVQGILLLFACRSAGNILLSRSVRINSIVILVSVSQRRTGCAEIFPRETQPVPEEKELTLSILLRKQAWQTA